MSKVGFIKIGLIFATFFTGISSALYAAGGCGDGYICASSRPVDVYNGCNIFYDASGDMWCTQSYTYHKKVACYGSDCSYTTGGWVCDTSTCIPYMDDDVHQGGCCVDDPCTPSSGCSCGSYASSNQGYGNRTQTCGDGCGGTTSSTCYCYQCTIDTTCSDWGYQSSNQGYGSLTPDDCENTCGVGRDLTCYCEECEFTKTCSGGGYLDTDQLNGSVIYDNCVNDCGVGKNLTCYCPAADCADLDDEVLWQNNEPSGEYRAYTGPVPIPNNPNGCPASQDKTCYIPHTENEPSTNLSLEIVPEGVITGEETRNEFSKDRILTYHSTTHSGRGLDLQYGAGLNNPVGLRAVYSDTDGQDDILALYVWWNPSATKSFPTPDRLFTSQARTNTNQNWGFMISRDSIGGDWNRVYAPRTYGSDRDWIQVGSVNESVSIPGSHPAEMVVADNISITDQGSDSVVLELTLEFNTDTDDTVLTRPYNLWAMANDYVGFIEFEEDNNIKDHNNWELTSQDWTLDMYVPTINIFNSPIDSNVSEITIDIDIEDEDKISHVRLDACKSGIDDPEDLTTTQPVSQTYNLTHCSAFASDGIDMTNTNSLLGNDGNSVNNSQYNREVIIDLGGNSEGAIQFYLTVLDQAGNLNADSKIYKLEQWITVKDGLVFGREGVTSSTRDTDLSNWDTHPLLENYRDSYGRVVDLTNQALLGARSLSSIFLRELVHSAPSDNNSFLAANYPGLFLTSPYQELRNAYRQKTQGSEFETKPISGTLSGDLSTSSGCTSENCVLESSSDLTISGLTCDRKALISVVGDVTLTPDVINADNDSVCIILASGDIVIQNGSRKTSGGIPGYDILEAFLIAGGEINILTEGRTPPNDDGLYVEGGLVSFTTSNLGTSVNNQREIHFARMGVYPVLVVDNNSKYGLFGKDLFGSQVNVFKSEIGFKPY